MTPDIALPDAPSGAPPGLSPRLQEVCALVADGLSNKEIARKLGIAEATVKVYLKAALRESGVNNRTKLAFWWQRLVACETPDQAVVYREILRELVDAGVELRGIRTALAGARGFDVDKGLLEIARERRA